MSTLTVGAGEIYTTIAAAVTASQDGDVIQVKAGTYTNDFLTVRTNITIEGVGGMVQMVATKSPPNRKGMIVTNASVTLENLEISGVKVADMNGAAVRYQGVGNLTILNCYFHDNQEGLLAASNPSGTITIKNSEFAYNGSNGLAHNVYINDVGTTIVDNSYIHDVLGHGSEFRSRGANTIITNSRIVDLGHPGNYTIDVPAGGKVVLDNDVLEKAVHSTNPIMVHFGPGGMVPFHPGSSLTVTNSTLISYYGARDWGVANMAASAGYNVVATLSDDKYYGLTASRLVSGPATQIGNAALATLGLAIATTHPWLGYSTPVASSSPSSSSSSSSSTSSFSSSPSFSTASSSPSGGSAGGSDTVSAVGHVTQSDGSASVFAAAAFVTGGGDVAVTAASSGNTSLTGGSGGATLKATPDTVTAAPGNDTVTFGPGAATVTGGTGGPNLYEFIAGQGGGTDVIRNFRAGTDHLTDAIVSESTVSGSTYLQLADNTRIVLANVAQLPSNSIA